jgi:hypothetical protein
MNEVASRSFVVDTHVYVITGSIRIEAAAYGVDQVIDLNNDFYVQDAGTYILTAISDTQINWCVPDLPTATPTATATATATATPTATAYPAPATNLDETTVLSVTQQLAGELTDLAADTSTPTFNLIALFGGMVIGFWLLGMLIRRLVQAWRND